MEQGDLIIYTSPHTDGEGDDVAVVLKRDMLNQTLVCWASEGVPRSMVTSSILGNPMYFEIIKKKKDDNE
tara:strand:+ start:1877 stop:2086 length:210 start_codon:yes stop_codon:yes gene_type:complete